MAQVTNDIREGRLIDSMSRRALLRRGVGLVGSLGALAVLAACEQAAPATAPPAQKQDQPAQPAQKAQPPAAKQQVTLTFWHHWGGSRVPLMEQMVNTFQERNSNVKVEMTLQPWDRRLEKLLTSVAGGNPPDVTMLGRQDVPNFVENNALVALDGHMARDSITRDMFYDGEIGPCYYQGKAWILPIPTAGGLPLVYYNRNLFRKVGLDPDKNPPKTWEELEGMTRQLTVIEGGKVKQLGINFSMTGNDQNPEFVHWLFANKGRLLEPPDGRKPAFGGPEGLETLEWMKRFVDQILGGQKALDGWTQPGVNPFHSQLQAMNISGVWDWFIVRKEAPDVDLGIFLRPANKGAELFTPAGDGWGYSIPRGTKHPDEAWLLVKYLTAEEEAAGWFMLEQNRPSPVKKFNENPEYGKRHPQWDTVLEALDTFRPRILLPPDAQMRQSIINMGQSVYLDKAQPRQALDQAVQESQKLLDEYWSKKK